jgi:hypothetical protein
MPNFEIESLLRWFHFIGLVLAGGSMPVCLLLSGFEDTHEDIRGLSAVVWKKMAVWGMRCAVCFGFILFILLIFKGNKPFTQPHLMLKIGLGPILLFLCETAPKPLAVGKRGLALIATVLFLVTSFVASNGKAFLSVKPNPAPESVSGVSLVLN